MWIATTGRLIAKLATAAACVLAVLVLCALGARYRCGFVSDVLLDCDSALLRRSD